MSHLYRSLGPNSDYFDRRSGLSPSEWKQKLRASTTVYVGNLTFYTSEDQIYALFNKCGEIDLIVMGLNRKKKSPCGFCFVRFHTHASANRAVECLNGIKFDERAIRVDWDSGDGIMEEARKFGRGVHGLQWRDEFRKNFDLGRGGEGGGLDYTEFIESRVNKKRRFADRQWDKYGNAYHNHIPYEGTLKRYRTRPIPPPPAPEHFPIKVDAEIAAPAPPPPHAIDIDTEGGDVQSETILKIEPIQAG